MRQRVRIKAVIAGVVAFDRERDLSPNRDRGRERADRLIDPGGGFLELSALAAWGTGFTVGASNTWALFDRASRPSASPISRTEAVHMLLAVRHGDAEYRSQSSPTNAGPCAP